MKHIMFFVTTKNLGKNPLIKPQQMEFDDKPCICIAPTIMQCLFGIGSLTEIRTKDGRYVKRKKPFLAYQCNKKGKAYSRVYDFTFTEEHRLYQDTQFQFHSIISESIVAKAEKMMNKYYKLLDDWRYELIKDSIR